MRRCETLEVTVGFIPRYFVLCRFLKTTTAKPTAAKLKMQQQHKHQHHHRHRHRQQQPCAVKAEKCVRAQQLTTHAVRQDGIAPARAKQSNADQIKSHLSDSDLCSLGRLAQPLRPRPFLFHGIMNDSRLPLLETTGCWFLAEMADHIGQSLC